MGSSKSNSQRPRPVTASYLRNAALHYLSARAASAAMVRATLTRRAKKRLAVRALSDETKTLIDKAVAELVGLGLIDDARFAASRATTLAAKGLPRNSIGRRLGLKGIAKATVATTAAAAVDDLTQARRYIERKRLGPYRKTAAAHDTQAKDLRALARAGFSYAIARKALADPK
jgi:regulatory protein